MSIPLVTICGSYNLASPWTKPCMESWQNMPDISQTFIVPDSGLSKSDADYLQTKNYVVFEPAEQVDEALSKYPNLKRIRDRDVLWRKLIDPVILLHQHEKVVLIDTDVFIKNPVRLPVHNWDMVYMREDVPSYDASWKIVWNEAMVPAINTGLVIFKPADIDFDFLENITGKYLLKTKNHWWTEQAAWSCIAGRILKKGLFDGHEVRVLCGFKKRTLAEIKANIFKFWGSNEQIKDYATFEPLLHDCSVVHFAGMGKKWFENSQAYFSKTASNTIVQLKVLPEGNLNFIEKLAISSRLFLKEQRA